MKLHNNTIDKTQFVSVISEAFPYFRRLHGQMMVVKCGGGIMDNSDLRHRLARDLSLLRQIGISIVLVHGGGPQVSTMIERLGLENRFHNGLRVTNDAEMKVVEMVLSGGINSEIVGLINHYGGNAIGLSGRDGRLIQARKWLRPEGSASADSVDLGRVGAVENIHVEVLHKLTEQEFMPVVAPIGVDQNGRSYNINADSVASRIAISLQCHKFILLTDTAGVLDKRGQLLTDLNLEDIEKLIADGTIKGGMLPKIEAATQAVAEGVLSVQIIDGRIPHSILLELFSDQGIGTLIRN